MFDTDLVIHMALAPGNEYALHDQLSARFRHHGVYVVASQGASEHELKTFHTAIPGLGEFEHANVEAFMRFAAEAVMGQPGIGGYVKAGHGIGQCRPLTEIVFNHRHASTFADADDKS